MIKPERNLCILCLILCLAVVLALIFATAKADAAEKSFTISWTAGNPEESLDGFELEYTLNDGEWTALGALIPVNADPNTTYSHETTITGAVIGTNSLAVRVRAVGDSSLTWSTSQYSDWSTSDAVTFEILGQPTQPGTVTITILLHVETGN